MNLTSEWWTEQTDLSSPMGEPQPVILLTGELSRANRLSNEELSTDGLSEHLCFLDF